MVTINPGPGRTCAIEHLDTGEWRVHVDTGRTLADACPEGGTANQPIPDDLTLLFDATSPVQARMVVATFTALGLHEALEWTRLDGRRLAAPHPAGAAHGEMWYWLAAELLDLVGRYVDRYPEPA